MRTDKLENVGEDLLMKVKELIVELQQVDGESRVFMGYDGNIVVTEPVSVIQAHSEILGGKLNLVM